MKKKSMSAKTAVFLTSLLLAVFTGCPSKVNSGGEDTPKPVVITVRGDSNITVKTQSFNVEKGSKWSTAKNKAAESITANKGFVLSSWKLGDGNGKDLTDTYTFEADTTVFAVSDTVAAEQIIITVKGSDHIVLGKETQTKVNKGSKWTDVKADSVITSVQPKQGWSIKEWKLNNSEGKTLTDDYVFEADTTVFAVSVKNTSGKITITVHGDKHIDIGPQNKVTVDQGTLWGAVKKEPVIANITVHTNYVIEEWRAGSKRSGQVLTDEYEFKDNTDIYANTAPLFDIGGNGFIEGYNCEPEALPKNIIIPAKIGERKIKGISKYVFEKCTGIETVDLSACEHFETIEEGAFEKCTGLISVKFPASLKEIKGGKLENGNIHSAFSGCTGLKGLLDLSVCSSMTKVSGFARCTGITGIKLPASVKEIDEFAFFDCTGLTGMLDLSSYNELTLIKESAFRGCSGISGLKLPSNLSEIKGGLQNGAFSGCKGIKGVLDLSSCAKLTKIAGFSNCEGLTGIKLPSSVVEICEKAFANCIGLTGTLDISACTSMTKISGFSGCENITEIRLPSSVVEIYAGAFNNCKKLTGTLDLSAYTKLKTLNGDVFAFCTGITGIKFPASLKEMKTGKELFGGLGTGTFTGCKSLEKVDFSVCTELKKINAKAFSGCVAINEIKLPTGITEIEREAFSSCGKISALDLSCYNQLTKIDADAFYRCKEAEITLGTSITSIEKGAFGDTEDNCVKKVKVPNDTIKDLVKKSGCPEKNIEVISSGSGS